MLKEDFNAADAAAAMAAIKRQWSLSLQFILKSKAAMAGRQTVAGSVAIIANDSTVKAVRSISSWLRMANITQWFITSGHQDQLQ